MNNFLQLCKVQFQALFFTKNRNKKNKTKQVGFLSVLILIVIFALLLSIVYTFMFYEILHLSNMENHILELMLAISSLIILMTSIFKVSGILFDGKDYEKLAAMPISNRAIIASKFFVLYLYEIIFSIVILLPSTFLLFMDNPLTLISSLLVMILAPVIPLIIGIIIGYLITFLTIKFRLKLLFQTLGYMLSILFVVFIYSFNFSMGETEEVTIELASSIISGVEGIFPVALVYYKGFINGEILYIILYLAGNALLLMGSIFLVSLGYKKINNSLLSVSNKKKYVKKELNIKTQFQALFGKEVKKLFTSPAYLFNCLSGGIMAIVFAFVLGNLKNTLAGYQDQAESFDFSAIFDYAYFLIIFMVSITSTTASSISIEGKNFWIIKSAPINPKSYFNSKIYVNDLVQGGLALIASLVLIFLLNLSFGPALVTIVVPLLVIDLMSRIGLFLNLHYYKLEWPNETAVVKNSASVMLTLLCGFVVCIIVCILSLITMLLSPYLTLVVDSILLLLMSFMFTKFINNNALDRLLKIN